MCGAAGAAGPTIPPDYEKGWTRLNDIMKGRKLPTWIPTASPPGYDRQWTKEDFILRNAIIQNTQEEAVMSKADHDAFRQRQREGQQGLPRAAKQ